MMKWLNSGILLYWDMASDGSLLSQIPTAIRMQVKMKKAVIFDMDGVIVDSEGLWQQAEKEVFSSLGVAMNVESCELTKTMTTGEVTHYWYAQSPWEGTGIEEVEAMVVARVIELIATQNCAIPGVRRFIEDLKANGLKIGLATNSPYKVIPRVLDKLALTHLFDSISSSEFVEHGKPSPAVYLNALEKLNEKAEDCVAIEDSNSGIEAAKRAGITVVAFTNQGKNKGLEGAHYQMSAYKAGFDLEMFSGN